MSSAPDVLVVGAGAVGAATARALALAGLRVLVVRPDPLPGEAWSAAAGMLAAQIEASPGDTLFALGVAGRAFYRREAPALLENTGIDVGLTQGGILQVATREADVELFKAKVAWQRQQAEAADFLEPEDVAEGWPWLATGHGAFWAPEDGVLLPDRLVAALLADAERLGARIITDRVQSLWCEHGVLRGVLGERDRYAAGKVVIAAGAWSGRIMNLPRPLSVEPVRGQVLSWPWPIEREPATVYGDHCYLLQRGNELLAGSTMEHAGFDASSTDEASDTIIRRLARLVPTIAATEPTARWAGLRPGTPDGVPIVGAEPRLKGLWYATGHGRNGILLAGITGELIAQSITGQDTPEALHPLRPSRFWSW
jgi:glycine oxidase